MNSPVTHDVDVLNRLIAQLHGAAAAYRRAGADGPGLSDVLGLPADAHDRTAEELAAMVRALGASPSPADAHTGGHAWDDLPRAVMGGEGAVAEAVKRVEAELAAACRAATDDPAVFDPVREAARRALSAVEAGRARTLQRLAVLADGDV